MTHHRAVRWAVWASGLVDVPGLLAALRADPCEREIITAAAEAVEQELESRR